MLKTVSGKLSKTVIFNLLVLFLGVIDLARPMLPPEYVPYIVLLVGTVNLVLRIFFTVEPLAKSAG